MHATQETTVQPSKRAPRNWHSVLHTRVCRDCGAHAPLQCPTCKGTGRVETGAIQIGGDWSYTRSVIMINATEKSYYGGHAYVLWFGAYGTTRLHVYARGLEDALEECAAWLADHAPGLITTEWSDEHKAWIKDVCEDRGITFPEGFEALENDEDRYAICEAAEADQTRTESGFLASWELGIGLENPTTEELYAYVTGQ